MNSHWRRILPFAVGLLTVVGYVACPGPTYGQFQIQAAVPQVDDNSRPDLGQNIFTPPPRELIRRLANARYLVEQQRYVEAARLLGSLLLDPDDAGGPEEDYFFQPDRKNSPQLHRSLKSEALLLIGSMPRAGRAAYELEFGHRARRLLDEALSEGNPAKLAKVSRCFFHTEAGYEATMLLGLYHLDQGRPLAAALTLRHLRDDASNVDRFEPTLSLAMATGWLQTGVPDQAEEALQELKTRQPDISTTLAGKTVRLFDNRSGHVARLLSIVGTLGPREPTEADRWTMFGGSPTRNASAAGGAPLLNMRWRVPATDDPLLEGVVQRIVHENDAQGTLAIPVLHPLAVGNVVLMRTATNLLAVDFSSGKRLWEVPVDEQFEYWRGNLQQNKSVQKDLHQLEGAITFRLMHDTTYGGLSSNGKLVFSIEDLKLGLGDQLTSNVRRQVLIGGQPQGKTYHTPCNRLAAHDIHTGKLRWHLGGPADQFALRQSETFFLGPPLPLMGRLYVLGETKGEVRVISLDAATGDELWSQQLCMGSTPSRYNNDDDSVSPLRRAAGSSPSYADGILVCPTGSGAVIAVDLATRSLLWAYRYERTNEQLIQQQLNVMLSGSASSQGKTGIWQGNVATIAEGCVLLTPVDSDGLHCLDLIDGKPLWKRPLPQENRLYLACVHQGKAIVVGNENVQAWHLKKLDETGFPKPAWNGKAIALPEGAAPSGRGFLSGNTYFLPLNSAEVLGIDLTAGEITHRAKSRKGQVPGNLICYQGKVISQGVGELETFYQLDTARVEVQRRLAANPTDPEALALQGEILCDDGKLAEGIDHFRRSFAALDDPRTKSLLRDALLEGLRRQFTLYRDRTDEIEPLLEDPSQRVVYLRLMAEGLRESREWVAAFEHCLKLAELDDTRPMEPIDKVYSVRLDRWVQSQIAGLRREADGEAVKVIDQTIQQQLAAALSTNGPDALRRFVERFGTHPQATEARQVLAKRLRQEGRLLQAEMVLTSLQQSSEPTVAGRAVAELASLLRETDRPDDAAYCYGRLRDEFADVEVADGKKGRQFVEDLDDDLVAQAMDTSDPWPVGKVEKGPHKTTTTNSQHYNRYALTCRGNTGPFFDGHCLRVDRNRRLLVAYDRLGHQKWELSLAEPNSTNQFFNYFNYSKNRVQVQGHLLILPVGYKLIAIDTLGSHESPSPRVVWSQDLTDSTADLNSRLAIQIGNLPWQLQQFQLARRGYQTNEIGPLTNHYVCFQRYRNLVVVDPLTGQTLWSRTGMAPGSLLFGDDQSICSMDGDGHDILVYRALDGELITTATLPDLQNRQTLPDGTEQITSIPVRQAHLTSVGSRLVLWYLTGGKRQLRVFDPHENKFVWPDREFSAEAQTCLLEDDALGVFEPDGRFVLFDLHDGRIIVEKQLEPEEDLARVHLLRSDDLYVLVTGQRNNPQPNVQISMQQLPGMRSYPIYKGRVYAFHRDGQTAWPQPVEIENQQVLLTQPDRLPVITFASQIYDRSKQGTQRYRVTVLCIDKRTGKVVFGDDPKEDSFTNSTITLDLNGDPKAHTVAIATTRDRASLLFTDRPENSSADDESDETDNVSSDGSSAKHDNPNSDKAQAGIAKALLKAVGKAITPREEVPKEKTMQEEEEKEEEIEAEEFIEQPLEQLVE